MSLPIVIVGGGTAGSTVALQLATATSRPIVVCEPGGVSHLDDEPRFFDVLENTHQFRHEDVQFQDRTFAYTQACVVGGGSAINGMLLTGAQPLYVEGLTSVPTEDDMGDISRALLSSGGRACQLWWNNGRWNPGRALVHLVEEGRVQWERDSVVRLHHSNGVVSAVELKTSVIETDCVVLAAGALGSPRLLLNSGFGEVCPSIGDGVQDHPSISFSLSRSLNNMGQFDATVVKDLYGENNAVGLMVGYERLSARNSDTGLVSVLLMNPESRGEITTTSDGFSIDLGLLKTARDVRAMRQLVRQAVAVLQGDSFANVAHDITAGVGGISLSGLSGMNDHDLDHWILREVLPVSHVSSSLASSVYESGQLLGASGVVVADASVLPYVPHETPAAAVTMEARRIGQRLGEKLA
ncbi:MAG: hypothetical protein RLY24_84 [Actinomycetota bacterium]